MRYSEAWSSRQHDVVFNNAMAFFVHLLAPGLRIFFHDDGAAVFTFGNARMRTGADAHIFAVAPVEQVVPRLLAFARMV